MTKAQYHGPVHIQGTFYLTLEEDAPPEGFDINDPDATVPDEFSEIQDRLLKKAVNKADSLARKIEKKVPQFNYEGVGDSFHCDFGWLLAEDYKVTLLEGGEQVDEEADEEE